jgi:2,3-diaminopropionate biosynthesis protein SbnB
MRNGDILILRSGEVGSLLNAGEETLMQTVKMAYQVHGRGDSSLPHSTFLRFPDNEENRIIALPAYLDGDSNIAGIKWVSSFPANIKKGLDRASAVVILNSAETGRPEVVIEGSIISAKRTAASAALAAQTLINGRRIERVGLFGCGLINFEITRFLQRALTGVRSLVIYDLDETRADQFKAKCRETFDFLEVSVAGNREEILKSCSLISFATTAVKPHIGDLSACAPGSTILHISLRDLSPEAILSADNIVDDVDHVCRAQTSVHLAEQLAGNRDFIRCTLADILSGAAPRRRDENSIAIFSPFGLGILDLAVSKLVHTLAMRRGIGTSIPSFLPDSWVAQK